MLNILKKNLNFFSSGKNLMCPFKKKIKLKKLDKRIQEKYRFKTSGYIYKASTSTASPTPKNRGNTETIKKIRNAPNFLPCIALTSLPSCKRTPISVWGSYHEVLPNNAFLLYSF